MSSSKRRDDWLDENEYPDERDIDDLGDDSPADYDPLTIGRVSRLRVPSPGRAPESSSRCSYS